MTKAEERRAFLQAQSATQPQTNTQPTQTMTKAELRRMQLQQPETIPNVETSTPQITPYANHGAIAQQGHQNIAQKQANIATNVTKPMTTYMQNGGSININDTASLAQLARERGMPENEINYLQGRQQASTLPSMQTQYKPLPGSTTPVAIPNSGYDPVKSYDIGYGNEEAQKVLNNVKMDSDDRSASTYVDAKANLEKAQREGNLREIAKNQGIIRNYENIYKSNYNKEWDKLKGADIKSLEKHAQGAAEDLIKSYEKLNTSTGENLRRAYDEYQRDLDRYNEVKSRYDEAITYDELINNNPIKDFGKGFLVGAPGAVAKGMTYGKLSEDALLDFFGSARNPANINANSLLDYNNENYQAEKYSGAIERTAGDTDVTGEYQNMSPASAFNRLKQLAENNPEYRGLQTLLREISTHSYKGTAQDLAKELDRISREMYQGWKNTHTQAGFDWEQAQQEHNERVYGDNPVLKGIVNSSITTSEMLPSVAAGFVGQPASMATLFASAAGGSADQAINEGATINQGTLYGALSGATEVGTELIGGENVNRALGIRGQSLLSKVFGDSIKNLHINSKAAKTALGLIFDVAGEMTEEGIAQAIEPLTKTLVYDPNAMPENVGEYFKDIFDAAIEAIPSTLLMEGLGGATNVVRINQVENGIINRINESDLSPIIKNQLANEVRKASRDVKLGLEESDYIEKRTNERYSTLQAQSEQMKQRIPQGYTLPQSTVDILAYTENNRPGLTIAFDNTIKGNGNFIDNGDGTRTITLNPNSKRAVEFVLTHELGHDLKGTNEYTELQNLLMDYAKGKPNYQKSLNALDKTYRESGANYNLQDEATNDMLGEAIGEQEFYNKLAENPTLFNRVTNGLKNLLGDKDTKLKNKIEKLTSNALKQEYRGEQQGTQQSLSETENDKTLAATHSLTEEKLRGILELGGFPVPSIAVSKPDIYRGENYGDATVFFNKDTIDPANKENEIYSRDIYSPRFPKIEYKINKDTRNAIQKEIVDIAGGYDNLNKNPYLHEAHLDMYDQNLSERLNSFGGQEKFINALSENHRYAYKYWFLKETQPDFTDVLDENGKIDTDKTNEKIDATINQDEYESWLRDKFANIVEKRGLRNNKDYYTNTGTPRSFEALHEDYTLDNVVKIMKALNTTGSESFFMKGFNEVAGTAAKKFNSIQDIKNSQDLLQNVSEENYKELLEPISNRLRDIETDIISKRDEQGLVSNYFIAMDSLGDTIQKVARKSNQKSKLTPSKVIDIMKKDYYDIDTETAQRIIDVIYDMKNLPTQYFESKPQRAVGFDEVNTMLIPNTWSDDTKQQLRDRGINYVEYDPTIEGDREAKYKEAAQDVLFSKSNGTWQQFLEDTYGKWNTGTKTNFESLPSNEELQQQERNSVAKDVKALNLESGTINREELLKLGEETPHKGEVFIDNNMAKKLNANSRIIKLSDIKLDSNNISKLRKIAKEWASKFIGTRTRNIDSNTDVYFSGRGVGESIGKDLSPEKTLSVKDLPNLVREAVYKNSSIDIDDKNNIYHYFLALAENGQGEKILNYITLKQTPEKTKFYYNKAKKIDEVDTSPRPGNNAGVMVARSTTSSVSNSIPPSNNSVNQQDNTQFSLSEEEQKEVNDYADKLFEDKTLDENFATDVYDRLKRVQNYSDFENIKQEVNDYKDKMYKGISSLADIANLKPENAKQQPMTYKQQKNKNTANQRRFFENVETSTIVAEETKNRVNSTNYEVKHNLDTMEKMRQKLDTEGNKLVEDWKTKSVKRFTDEDVALGSILLERYQQNKDFESAARTAEKLADVATESARALQMFSIWQRLSPETMQLFAQKQLNEAFEEMKQRKTGKWVEANKDKFKLTAEETQFIYDQVEKASQAIDDETKQRELSKIETMINNKLPPEKGQAIKALRRLAMLGNIKTQVRNFAGNAIIVPINDVVDVIGTAIDKAIATKTGVRTTALPQVGTQAKGFGKGLINAWKDYKTNTRTTSAGSKYEFEIGAKPFNENTNSKARNFINRKLNAAHRLLGAIMSGGDRPFAEAAYQNSLKGQMKANKVTEATPEMIDIATNESLQRTWNDDNNYTKTVLTIRRAMNNININGFGLGDLIIPFAKTPANLTKAIVEYSPAGFIESVIDFNDMRKAISRGEMTAAQQKKFVTSMSKAITGTILYAVAGSLVKAGAITGSADDDKDVKNFEQNVLGIQPYSVRLGDKTYTYSWANPINAPLAIMADTYKMTKENANKWDILKNAFTVAGDVLTENSFLQGIKELFSSEGITKGFVNAVEDAPASFVPTLFSQIAQAFDNKKRQTFEYKNDKKTVANSVKYKIPGARNTLEPQVNTFGEEIENDTNPFNVFLSPANVREAKTTEAQNELYSLYEATKDKTIFPVQVPYYVTDDGEKKNLTPKQRNTYQKASGKYATSIYDDLFDSDYYDSISDSKKTTILQKVAQDANKIGKTQVGVWTEESIKLDYRKQDLEDMSIPLADYYIAWSAQKDVEGDKNANGKTINLSSSKNKKEAIDKAVKGLEQEQMEMLYGIFDISEKVW